MDAAQDAIAKVAPLSYDMMLLGENGLATEFPEVRQVGEFVRPAFVQYHQYLVENFARLHAAREEGGEQLQRTTAEVQASLPFRRYWKASEHLSRAGIDLQFAAQRRIGPDSLPERKLPNSVEMDLPPMPPGMSPNPFRRLSPLDWNAGDTADDEPPTPPTSH
jgi:hypothetical protein